MMRKIVHIAFVLSVNAAVLAYGLPQCLAQPKLPVSPKANYDLMVEASKRMQAAERIIYRTKFELNLISEQYDVNRTGLVGMYTSITTTTPGLLSAKRAATNPDFAAYLVDLFLSHGLNSQDSVLLTMTGSLPGFNLAAAIALDLLDIPSLRVVSLGSSAYGANVPDMTWIDIEDILYREGIFKRRSDYVTLGAVWDIGTNLSDGALNVFRDRCARLGYPLLESATVEEQRTLRLNLFGDPNKYAVLINIGGNHLMIGDRDEDTYIPGGWIRAEGGAWNSYRTKNPAGIIFDYLDAGIPVINLLHVEDICKETGVPYDPKPLPRVGTSPVFFQRASE